MKQFKPALTLIAFNRPEKVKQLLQCLHAQKFRSVYVVIDGPRSGNETDSIAVKNVISLIRNHHWDCPINFNCSDTNLGCKLRVSSGLSWVFEHEQDSIILEDDILPDPSFFPFISLLLEKYRDDTRVMHISGCNLQGTSSSVDSSYYFSKYSNIWGWATWSRAWKFYRHDIPDWPETKSNFMNLTFRKNSAKNWSLKLQRAYDGSLDTWDFQWLYTIMMQNGICINPKINLIQNTGFDSNATHLTLPFISKSYGNLKSGCIDFPLIHPCHTTVNSRLDIDYEKTLDPHVFYAFKDYIYHELLN